MALLYLSCHPPGTSASRALLARMQLTLHATRRTPHGASRLVQAMPAWSLKTRHAPSRHCRNARVYGHTTTAMHKLSTPSPLPSPPRTAAFVVSAPNLRQRAHSPLHHVLVPEYRLSLMSVRQLNKFRENNAFSEPQYFSPI